MSDPDFLRRKNPPLLMRPFNRFLGDATSPPKSDGYFARKKRFVARLFKRGFAPRPWLPLLRGRPAASGVAVVYCLDASGETARAAGEKLNDFFLQNSLAPVLITASPEFSFWSRMGWLVEYLPGDRGHARRKLKYLGARYRGAKFLDLNKCAGRIAGGEGVDAFLEEPPPGA